MGKAGKKSNAPQALQKFDLVGEMVRGCFLEPLARFEALAEQTRRVVVPRPVSSSLADVIAARLPNPSVPVESPPRKRNTVAGVVARLRRGRPPYLRPPITAVVERAIEGGVDPSLSDFRDRVRSLLELEGIPAPGDTVLEEICKPVYKREHAKIAKK